MQTLSLNAGLSPRLAGNLSRHTNIASLAMGRLSSGNRLQHAGDDVAAMSVATKLSVRVTALRSARVNAAQAASMLQVMDGGLRQIHAALDRMMALSVQAASGSLADAERGFLNQEFQQLSKEIDRIAENTNFNGVKLLDVDSATEQIRGLAMDTSDAANASAYINFFDRPTNNQTFRIQNITFRFRTNPTPGNPLHIRIGATVSATVDNLIAALNAHPDLKLHEATYEHIGEGLMKITSKSGGEMARHFTIAEQDSSSRTRFFVTGADLVYAGGEGRWALHAEDSAGLGQDSVIGVGSTGGGLLADQAQTSGQVVLSMAALTGGISNNQRIRIDNGIGGLNNFTFRTNPTVGNVTHIRIGADNKESLRNAVKVLTEWPDVTPTLRTHAHRQLEFERDGLNLIIRYNGVGNGADYREALIQVAETLGGGTLSGGFVTGAADTGINTSAIHNADFTGKIQGFTAEYLGLNQVRLSVMIGEHEYATTISNTAPAAATRVRADSAEAGYFDMDLSAGGMVVASQEDADKYAVAMDAAFGGVTFYQERTIEGYNPYQPELQGSSLSIRREDFSEPMLIDDFSVTGGSDKSTSGAASAVFSITINGEKYTSTKTIERGIEPYAKIEMFSEDNPNRAVTFHNGATQINTLNDGQAADFEAMMKAVLPKGDVLGVTEANNQLSFQVGARTSNTLSVNLESMRVETLFNGESPAIDTVEHAVSAQDSIRGALAIVAARRAEVGAQQSRTDYAFNYISNVMGMQENARAELADTNIARSSTRLATQMVLQQSTIAMLAQTNQLQQDMVTRLYEAL